MEDKQPQRNSHVCLHEADFTTMSMNIEKICRQVDAIHKEVMGPPGQPGLKAKVERHDGQIKGIAGVIGLVGTAFLGLLAKVWFFTQ